MIGTMSNPWTSDTPEGTLLSILSSQGCQGNVTEEDISDNSSLKIISALKEISSLSEAIHSAELEVLNRNLHKDNKELIGLQNMTQIQSIAQEVAECLTLILDNRDGLVARLKSPHEEGRLVVEARYQKYAVSTFEQLGKVLTQLTGYISNVEKYKACRLNEENVEQSARQILDLANLLKTLYDNLRSEYQSLLSIRDSSLERSTLVI
ncbi:hypothetical protein ACHWQZ_G008658 [Mnemiopsis leidyi]